MIVAPADRDIERARLWSRRDAGLSLCGDHTVQKMAESHQRSSIDGSRKLSRRAGFAHNRQAPPDGNERQKSTPPDRLRMSFRVATEIGQALNKII